MKIPDSLSDFIHIFGGNGGGRHGQWLINYFPFFPPFAFFLAPPQIWVKSPTQFPAMWIGGFLTPNRIWIFSEDTVQKLPYLKGKGSQNDRKQKLIRKDFLAF
jgi:hypothetical protein